MSDTQNPWAAEPSPSPRPVPVAAPPPRRSLFGWMLRGMFLVVIGTSLALNLLILLVAFGFGTLLSGPSESRGGLHERYHSGKKSAKDKIAIIHVEGVIMEGMTSFAGKQIDEAAGDDDVKAVVLRINSPGGSITASDDLFRRFKELRDGNPAKNHSPKPLVVSMASLAASGGYYIAMPAKRLLAERTTITGSIGVYAAFPNVAKLAKDYGVSMNVIKAGEVKDSGSMFHPMTLEERQLWQDMVDQAFKTFLSVVEEGRPQLKDKLREVIIKEKITGRNGEGVEQSAEYVRRRADGGIFTAEQALKYGLIDQIGYLDDAIAEARKAGNLGEDYKAITYQRPPNLLNSLLGIQAPQRALPIDPSKLAEGVVPRLWFMTPQSELAGLLGAMGRE